MGVQAFGGPNPEAFLTIVGLIFAALLAFLYFVVKPWVESLTWPQWQQILGTGTRLFIGLVLIVLAVVFAGRLSVRAVPENHTAVIRTRIKGPRSLPFIQTEGNFVQWPWLKSTMYDTRGQRTEMRVECHTCEGIPITMFVLIRWALDHEQLHLLDNLASPPVQHLSDIVHKQLSDLVVKRNLLDLAQQLIQISTHLQQILIASLYGDTRTGIAVSEVEVLGFDAPRTRLIQPSAEPNR